MSFPLPPPYLCLVTDRRLCGKRTLEEVVVEAMEGGVNIVQLREKDMPSIKLLRLAEWVREKTEGHALLFINDRLDVAVACGADGVQLTEQSLTLEAARRVLPSGSRFLLGRSVHGYEGAVEADSEGAHLLVVGTLFPTQSHPGTDLLDLDLLRRITAKVRAPVFGIGGISSANAAHVIRAGAEGVAVTRAVLDKPSPKAAARKLRKAIESAWFSSRS